MSGPFCGGHRITGTSWEGPFAYLVRFSTTYSDMCHQVYVGRVLVGFTESVTARQIMCSVQPSDWPEEVQLLAVDPDDRATDFGALLPPRPYNAVKLSWTTTDWDPGTRFCEVTGATEAGGDVDADNVLANVLFDTDRDYEFVTEPLPGSGLWPFEIAGIDQTLPDGNRGPAAEVEVRIDAHPPDVQVSVYDRLTAAISGSNLVVSFTEPEL